MLLKIHTNPIALVTGPWRVRSTFLVTDQRMSGGWLSAFEVSKTIYVIATSENPNLHPGIKYPVEMVQVGVLSNGHQSFKITTLHGSRGRVYPNLLAM